MVRGTAQETAREKAQEMVRETVQEAVPAGERGAVLPYMIMSAYLMLWQTAAILPATHLIMKIPTIFGRRTV